MRIFVSVVAALVVGGLTVFIFETIGHSFHPFPEGANFKDPETLKKHIESAPLSAMLMVIAGHFFAGIFGNITALMVAKRKRIAAFIFSALLIAATVANVFMMPHPVWFMIIDIAAVLVGSFIILKLIKKPNR